MKIVSNVLIRTFKDRRLEGLGNCWSGGDGKNEQEAMVNGNWPKIIALYWNANYPAVFVTYSLFQTANESILYAFVYT